MKQPDKFFRNKLEGHEIPAPESAWSKIEMATKKKTFSWTWLQLAASLLVIGSFVGLFWLRDTTHPDPIAQKQNNVKPDTSSTVEKPALTLSDAHKEAVVSSKKSEETKTVISAKPLRSSPTQPGIKPETIAHVETNPKETVIEPESITENTQPEKLVASNDLTHDKINDETDSGYKLTITSSEVNLKYLKKSYHEATSDTLKPSGIRKLLDKANDLKHDQDPFGELRQMKNEVLALNIPVGKKNEQNK